MSETGVKIRIAPSSRTRLRKTTIALSQRDLPVADSTLVLPIAAPAEFELGAEVAIPIRFGFSWVDRTASGIVQPGRRYEIRVSGVLGDLVLEEIP